MNEFHVAKVVQVSPIKTVIFSVVIKRDSLNGQSQLDVLAKISLVQHGVSVKKEATNVIIKKR